jgi:hypothetical protein
MRRIPATALQPSVGESPRFMLGAGPRRYRLECVLARISRPAAPGAHAMTHAPGRVPRVVEPAGSAATDAASSVPIDPIEARDPPDDRDGGAIPNTFDRMTDYLGREYAAMKRGTDITLEQLLARLHIATRDNRDLRRGASPLMMLIASDIRAAKDFPVSGLPVNPHRSVRAWRQRYNGLERYLPKPS